MTQTLDYMASPTLSALHKSQAWVRFVMGPVGSGKTTGCIMEMLMKSCAQEAHNGVRRTRWVIIRNTRDQLRSTVLKDIQALLDPIIRYKVTDYTIYLTIPMPDGTRVESEWILMPLESTEDQRRLLSTQLTGAYLNEFREIDYELLGPLLGRLGRYPSKTMGGPTWYGLIGDTNPFSEGSEWYKNLVVDLPHGWQFFIQPGGLTWPDLKPNPAAENMENLPNGYYDNLIKGQPIQFIKVHACGLYGDDLAGQVVFKDSFDLDWHVAKETTEVIPGATPLIIGCDLGRTPCATISQWTAMGGMVFHDEVVSEGMGLENFVKTKLLPVLSTQRYAGKAAFVVFDPAGVAKSQYNEISAKDVFEDNGLPCVPAGTNDVGPRLRAWEHLMLGGHKGMPNLLIDPRCDTLIRSLRYEYKYKRLQTGRIENTPEKKHPWSDVVDAGGYAAIGGVTGIVAEALSAARYTGKRRQEVPSASAWT